MRILYTNATLVLPDRLLENGWLLAENGKIRQYGTGKAPAKLRPQRKSLTAAESICLPDLSMSTATAVVVEAS